jgi:hypothetical protein
MHTHRIHLLRALRRHRGEGGQAITEFAMVLPLVAFLVVSVILLGKALWAYIDLTQAADEAARLVAVDQPTNAVANGSSLETYVRSLGSLPAGAHLRIHYCSGSQAVGQPVQVVAYTGASWVPFFNIGEIKGIATMRLEQSTTGNASVSGSGACE